VAFFIEAFTPGLEVTIEPPILGLKAEPSGPYIG
jgi:hypothetical protein